MTYTGNTRYNWIDSMKLFACILVVLGHLYMSMVSGGWIDETAVYYCLPIQMVYTFHVPLFFVCSGFLYQIKSVDYSMSSHIKNIKIKALSLGVPYFVFSIITILLKMVFASEVNNQATPMLRTLFWEPVAPYWYLYTLFFLFCLIPCFQNKKYLNWAFLIALMVKIVYVVLPWKVVLPDLISKLASNAIWFLFGMVLTQNDVRKKMMNKWGTYTALIMGGLLSVMFYRHSNSSRAVQFVIAMLFVYSLTSLFIQMTYKKSKSNIADISRYFMPVYLMHTIFAAGIRIVLLKMGIHALGVHIVVGVIVSIAIPILVYEIAKKSWLLLFWIEPIKAIKVKGKKNV